MSQESKILLHSFDHAVLKQELHDRGAAMHAAFSSGLPNEKKNLGGNIELVKFSSSQIADVLREKQKGIYGVDDRKDIYQISDKNLIENSKGVVSLFRASRIVDNEDGSSTLQVGKFGEINRLCVDEPFFNQPVGAFCSGFLVAPNIIATAGHCVNETNVTTIRFVFGFRMLDATKAQIRLNNSDIYSGTEVIGRKQTDETDWCLVKLDRVVVDKQILRMREKGKIADGESLYVMGHPSGLTLKYADNANVRTNTKSAFFTANLDTYGGNSGSPVFNSVTNKVEGILVRGATDFVPVGSCMVSAVCPTNGCEGEDCTRVSEFIGLLP